MIKTDIRDIWTASVLGIASSLAAYSFASFLFNPYESSQATNPGFDTFSLFLMIFATVVGGAVAGALSRYRWLPTLIIAVCMTVWLDSPDSMPALAVSQAQWIGGLIALFVGTTFGQSLTRRGQMYQTSDRI